MGFTPPPVQKNYVFNLTGTIHGYGDITGPLWTLLKIKQLRPNNNYIAVVDDRAEQIISSMYGEKLELVGDDLGIQFFRLKDASHIPTADVSFELFFSGRKIHYKDNTRPFTNLIYNDPNTITVISDTMHGTTLDEVVGPGIQLYFKPPGIGNNRSGIITDPYLEKILDYSPSERRTIAADLFNDNTLKNTILKHTQKNVKFSFLYGAHNEVLINELIGQTKLFINEIENTFPNQPIIIFTPNSQEDLKKAFPEIDHLYSINDLHPDFNFENHPYIISIPKMTSFQFLALMAIADLPILIEGNSSVSSAIRLNKQFLVYRSAWNAPQIHDLLQIDQESEAKLYTDVYHLETLTIPHFDHFFAIDKKQKSKAKYSLSSHTPDFPTKLLNVVELAEKLKKQNKPLDYLKIAQNTYKKTNDAFLEYSLILNGVWQNKLTFAELEQVRQNLTERGFDFRAMEARFVPNWPNFIEKTEDTTDTTKDSDSNEPPEDDKQDTPPEPSEKYGIFPAATQPLSNFKEISKDIPLAHHWESEIQRHAKNDPEMIRLRKKRDETHAAGFTYDVIQSRNSPKMVVHGSPRSDRENCVEEFYKMILNEKVRVIVALNTFSDWEKAISYYDNEQLAATNTGWKITCTETKVLYEGAFATNIPKKIQKKLGDLTLDDRALAPYRVRLEERTLIAKKDGETRTITHLHYVNWPDHSEAPDLAALELLIQRQESLIEHTNEPVSIHCQGGIGRTLGYIQCIWMRKEIREAIKLGEQVEEKQFNLPEMTYELKKQAPRLGGSPNGERFALVYATAAAYLEGQKNAQPKTLNKNKLSSLRTPHNNWAK